MTLTSRSDEHTTSMEEYTVTAISGSEFTAKLKFTMTIDGNDANGGNYGNARRMTDDTVEPQ